MQVTLVAPWLAHFAPQWHSHADMLPETSALNRWLRFSRRESSRAGGRLTTMPLRFFQVELPQGSDTPFGALSCLGDGGNPGSEVWVRVDPVHMRPDMAKLLVFASPDIEITHSHAEEIGGLVGEALADWGKLSRQHPRRWYLRLNESPGVTTTPLPRAVGLDVEQALPQGESGALWRARINEIQMRLFASEINIEREQSGMATINGVWLWGVGKLPSVPRSSYTSVVSDSPIVRGLSIRSGVKRVSALKESPDDLLSELGDGEHLVWLDTPNSRLVGDPSAWSEWLSHLENRWPNRLLDGVASGEIERIALHGGDGVAHCLDRGAMRRFWRSAKPFPHQIHSSLSEGV